MKTHIYRLFTMPVMAVGFAAMLVSQAGGQTFNTLYSFTGGSDGAEPYCPLILSGNTLYGTTFWGQKGTVFALSADGTGFTTLYSFTGSDPSGPEGGLLLSGNTLYGTSLYGGTGGNGTVFGINTDGTGLTILYAWGAFTGIDGGDPSAGLILLGDTFYGTTYGEGGGGSVFRTKTDGTGYGVVYSSTSFSSLAPLTSSGNTLYGVSLDGRYGTVFAVNTDGTGFTNLHSFLGSDGTTRNGGLVLLDDTLYGTAQTTVFKVSTNGTGFTILHRFPSTALNSDTHSSAYREYTNSDGALSLAGLILSGNVLYGATSGGGTSGMGTVFKVHTDGTGFATLHNFAAPTSPFPANSSAGVTNSDGASPDFFWPSSSLVVSNDTLYGTTPTGGQFGFGTIFSISLPPTPPQLTITPVAGGVILTWPTNATGFALQSSTNLGATAVWTPVSALSVVINGQNTVTNPIWGIQQFYRLVQPVGAPPGLR